MDMASSNSQQQRPRARLGVAILAGGIVLALLLVTVSAIFFAASDDDSDPASNDSTSAEADPDALAEPDPNEETEDDPAADPTNEPDGKPTTVELRRVQKVMTQTANCEKPGIWCSETGGSYRLGPAELETKDIVSADARISDYGDYVVGVTLSDDGAQRFEAVTTELSQNTGVQSQLAIVVDGLVVSAPTVQGPIPGGEIDISAKFTQQEAERLAEAIDP